MGTKRVPHFPLRHVYHSNKHLESYASCTCRKTRKSTCLLSSFDLNKNWNALRNSIKTPNSPSMKFREHQFGTVTCNRTETRQSSRKVFQPSLSALQKARHSKSAAFRDVTCYCVSPKLSQLLQHTTEEWIFQCLVTVTLQTCHLLLNVCGIPFTLLVDLNWYMETEGTAAPASEQTSIKLEDVMRTPMLCCLCVSVLSYENKELSVIQVAELQELSATSVLEQEHKSYYSKM